MRLLSGEAEEGLPGCRSYHPVDPNSYPVSIPGSPGSSLRGHALSHVTYSPGR